MSYNDFEKSLTNQSTPKRNVMRTLITKDVLRAPFSKDEMHNATSAFMKIAALSQGGGSNKMFITLEQFRHLFGFSETFTRYLYDFPSGRLMTMSFLYSHQ